MVFKLPIIWKRTVRSLVYRACAHSIVVVPAVLSQNSPLAGSTGSGADDTGSAAAGQSTVLETAARSEEPYHSWHSWAEADMVATT